MKPGDSNGKRRLVAGVLALMVSLWLGNGQAVGAGRDRAGAELEAEFQAANRLYEQGDFESAAAVYDRLLEAAPGAAALHYNLGNARFKAGRVGMAIWHYRVARDLSPRDADIRANLRFARKQAGTQELDWEGRIGRWLGLLTLDEWCVVSGVLFWCGMGGIAAAQLRPRLWRPLRFWARVLLVAWVGCVAGLGAVWHGQHGRRMAVVVAEGAIRYGPFEESQVQFVVPDGAELAVLEARDSWVRVEHPRRGAGWMDRSQVRFYPGD